MVEQPKRWCPRCKNFMVPLPGRAPESHPMGYGAYVEHCPACLAELTGVREADPAEWAALRERAEAAERLLDRLEVALQADRLGGPREETLVLAAETWPKRLRNEVDLSASLRRSLEASEQEVCSLRAQLAGAEEEIASRREQLADYLRTGMATGVRVVEREEALSRQLAEKGAALVAAGQALSSISACIDAAHVTPGLYPEDEHTALHTASERIRVIADEALSAPALARAVELDRARREVVEAAHVYKDCAAGDRSPYIKENGRRGKSPWFELSAALDFLCAVEGAERENPR